MANPNNQRLRLFSACFNFHLFAIVLVGMTALFARGQGISLNDALDDDLTWSMLAGELPWFGQTVITHDGVSAAQVGPGNDSFFHGPQLSTTVTGPAIVSFWWRLRDPSDESSCWATVDYDMQDYIFGAFDWTNNSVTVDYGVHTLTWGFSLFGATLSEGWLDSVQVTPITSEPPVITTQAFSQTVAPHGSVVLSVAATGTPQLAYQWTKNGNSWWSSAPNTTQSALELSNVTFSDAGTYAVTVQNVFGTATSSATMTVSGLPLDESLDVINMHWEDVSTGISHWFGQTNVTGDGVDAVESWAPNIITEFLPVHTMQATVTGPARFSWAVKGNIPQSFSYYPDMAQSALYLKMDGAQVMEYPAPPFDWRSDYLDIPHGTHQLRWEHVALGAFEERVWLDQFALTPLSGDPPAILQQPQSITVVAGGDGQLSVVPLSVAATTNYPPLDPAAVQWMFGTNIAGYGATLQMTNIRPNQAGPYFAIVSNLFGLTTSFVATVTVTIPMSLGEALDATNLIWATDPNNPWFADVNTSHDGHASAQWGGDGSWLDTTVVGPGLLTLWTKSMPWTYNSFEVKDNGTPTGIFLDVDVDWAMHRIPIGPGTHNLRFGTGQPEMLAGPWIDEVKFVHGNFAAPKILQAPRDTVVAAGKTAMFHVTASSPLPMTYQWYDNNGFQIEDATNATLYVSNVDADASPGYYSCNVDNGMGTTTIGARLLVRRGLTTILGTAVTKWDTVDPTAPWVAEQDPARGLVVHSPKIGDGSSASLSGTVIGPGRLSFWWKVSSEKNFDMFTCSVNYEVAASISGETGWRRQTVRIPEGAQAVSWQYSKDADTSKGQDRAWLGPMTFLPDIRPTVHIVQQNPTIYFGESAVLKAVVSGTGPFTYNWSFNGGTIDNATNSTLVVDSSMYNWYVSGPFPVSVTVSTPAYTAGDQTILTVKSAIEGQRVVVGSPVRLVFNVRPPAPASVLWSDAFGPLKDIYGYHGTTTPVLTINPGNVRDDDSYAATATTRSGWSMSATGYVMTEPQDAVIGWGFDSYNGEVHAPQSLDDVVSVAMAVTNGAVLHGDRTVTTFGQYTDPPYDWRDITAIAVGDNFTLGLKSDGTVLMATEQYAYPSPLPSGLSGVVGISVSGQHCLAVRDDGTVMAWGSNDFGESTVPSDLSDVVAVSAGGGYSMALKRDGTVIAWGDDSSGKVIPPATARNVKAIAAGGSHSLALRRDGTVVAWGDNSYGQSSVPVGLKNVVAIAAGAWHSVALKADGTVVTWGGVENWNYSMASGTVPQGLTHVAAISTGYQYDTYAVIYAPVIVGDFSPVITVLDGVALTVNARGRPPMTYQWRLNGRNIPDETGFQLVIGRPHSNAEAARLKYDVVVSNAFGTTTSASIIAPFVEANAGAVTGAPSAPPVITPILPLPPTPTNGGNAGLIIEMMPLRPTLTVVPPGTLKMMRSEHNVLLMWANTPGAVLESTDDLTRGFSQDNSDASVAGGLKILRVTPNAAQRFYRVRQN